MISCKKCGSEKYAKNGKEIGYQKYLCKECGCNFIEGDRKTNKKIKGYFPERRSKRGRPGKSNQEMLNAILWIAHSGAA